MILSLLPAGDSVEVAARGEALQAEVERLKREGNRPFAGRTGRKGHSIGYGGR
jgi:hypothetical protein